MGETSSVRRGIYNILQPGKISPVSHSEKSNCSAYRGTRRLRPLSEPSLNEVNPDRLEPGIGFTAEVSTVSCKREVCPYIVRLYGQDRLD